MSDNVKGWVDVASVHYIAGGENGPTLCGVERKRVPACARTNERNAVTCKQCKQGLESIARCEND